jgi:hypothetical protein
MLHRYLFTFSLIVAFSLTQLGLFTHDISHLQQRLDHSLQGQAVVGQTHSSQNSFENTSNRSVSGASDLNLIDAKNATPKTANSHVCENCVGFAAMAMVNLQSPFVLSLHHQSALPLYLFQSFSLPATLRFQSARAPPTHLS